MYIKITLSDIISYIHSSGSTKGVHVQNILTRKPYHPALDYYKKFRDLAQNILIDNRSPDDVFEIFDGLDDKKVDNYQALCFGFNQFVEKQKRIEWIETKSAIWSYKNLQVIVNPDFGFIKNDKKILVKMYLKEEKLMPKETKVMLNLMEDAYSLLEPKSKGLGFAILDVRRAKLHMFKGPEPRLKTILKAESESFLKIWEDYTLLV